MKALAVGNFDGVHRGHQKIIETMVAAAAERALTPTVLTFEPHPYRFFRPDAEPFVLTPKPMKERLLKQLGVRKVHFARFDAALAAQTAEQFVAATIIGEFAARLVVVGEDFAFGKDRRGSAATIAELGKSGGFVGVIVDKAKLDGVAYSSTLARQHIRRGEMPEAAAILGRHFAIDAPVVGGSGRGAELGFATANLDLDDQSYVRPKIGVYAASCGGKAAVVNYGTRPTFGGKRPIMEVHIIDKVMGKTRPPVERLRVELREYLRGERKFADADALKVQIAADIAQTKKIAAI